MKIEVGENCIRCSLCVEVAPELFEMDEANDVIRVKVDEVPPGLEEKARLAAESCAVQEIKLVS
ncbi:MAG TPA: ferredoxin [Candidatus Nanoarchaeia archaeon]|nr:ferredoxin [Candidatus Nanoarchaeia archaeon]